MERPGSEDDFERLVLCQHVCQMAKANYVKNPLDSNNLVQWGSALLDLCQFQNAEQAEKTIKDVISKMEEALIIEPTRYEAMWVMGNAYFSLAFMVHVHDEASGYFDKASEYFIQAADGEPGNERYHKSLEMADKGPELYKEIYRQGFGKQPRAGGHSASANAQGVALYDLHTFQNPLQAESTIKEAISKLEESLSCSTDGEVRTVAVSLLGEAHRKLGFLAFDFDEAMAHFDAAASHIRRALDEDPENEKLLELLAPMKKGARREIFSDQMRDRLGYVIATVGFAVWIGMKITAMTPPPPPM